MLVKLEISNFCSFRDDVEFSLVASREKLHREQHIYSSGGGTDLLRIAVIYGANASGKSNFIRAVEFAKRYVTHGVRPKRSIGSTTYKLDKKHRNLPSRFYFEIQIEPKKYSYEFVLSQDEVLSEELCEFTKTTKKTLFKRQTEKGENNFEFGPSISRLKKDEQQFYKFTMEGTRKNQLFLTESIHRNATQFQDVYDWFDNSLKIFTPRSISHGVEFRIGKDKNFTEFLKKILFELDSSVVDIKSELVDADASSGIPSKVLSEIESELDEESAVFISNQETGTRSVVLKEEGDLKLLKIFTQHKCTDSNEKVTFELEEESDGTRRTIELAPLFYELMETDKCTVAFIDELDRSLHPILTRRLIELFLKNERTKKSQMIVATHDTDLLDTRLLRRDVVWLISKEDGVSNLLSLQRDFNPRHDKDIRKDYLEGEYGAVPFKT